MKFYRRRFFHVIAMAVVVTSILYGLVLYGSVVNLRRAKASLEKPALVAHHDALVAARLRGDGGELSEDLARLGAYDALFG